MPYPGRADDSVTGVVAGVCTVVNWAFDLHCVPVDRGDQANPDAWADMLAGHLHLGDLTAQHPLQYDQIVGSASDIDPAKEVLLSEKGRSRSTSNGNSSLPMSTERLEGTRSSTAGSKM